MNNLWIVDAFTPVVFRGNPAAVYLLPEFLPKPNLQRLAAQANLSETAFVVKRNGKLIFDLRWFTPEVEVDLCGHATLAAAHVLVQAGQAKTGDIIRFQTKSGELKARVLEQAIELDFPTMAGEKIEPEPLLSALGVLIWECYKNRDDYLVLVKDYKTLVRMRPDMKKLAKLDTRGVIVTTAHGVDGYDFASRFFAPRVGVNEDPVTGSAHCFLAPYWAERLGKTGFYCLQASRARGELYVKLMGERTLIIGQCVTTIKGTIDFLQPTNKPKTTKPKTKKGFSA